MADSLVKKFVGNMEKKGPVKTIKVKVKMKDGSSAKLKMKSPPKDADTKAKNKLSRGMKGYKK